MGEKAPCKITFDRAGSRPFHAGAALVPLRGADARSDCAAGACMPPKGEVQKHVELLWHEAENLSSCAGNKMRCMRTQNAPSQVIIVARRPENGAVRGRKEHFVPDRRGAYVKVSGMRGGDWIWVQKSGIII